MTISRTQLIIALSVALLIGSGGTWLLYRSLPSSAHTDPHPASEHADRYTCPMHPAVVSDSPGTCPICHMDLIPQKRGGSDLDESTLAAVEHVALSPVERVLANVHTTVARAVDNPLEDDETALQSSDIRAPGVIAADPNSLAEVPSWLEGRIETLHVKKVGATIERGQAIMDIYSPDLYAAQQEYLFAYAHALEDDQNSPSSMLSLTQERLLLLGMDKRQIQRIQQSQQPMRSVTVRAPNAGTITDVHVRQGQYVDTGTPLFEVEDHRSLRVEAAVRARDLPWIKVGAKVRVNDQENTSSSTGTVEFIAPTLDSSTRTVTVRIVLDQQEPWLPKGAFVTAYITRTPTKTSSEQPDTPHDQHASPEQAVTVIIPRTAVIQGGIFNRVYVESEPNVFEARDVDIQAADKNHFLVHRGLVPGDVVVTSGAFLLDSEAQLHAFGTSHQAEEETDHHTHTITRESIPTGGIAFDPPIPISQAPDDVWLCNMSDKVHWIQKDQKDATCPLCKMDLIHHDETAPPSTNDVHDHHGHGEDHP